MYFEDYARLRVGATSSCLTTLALKEHDKPDRKGFTEEVDGKSVFDQDYYTAAVKVYSSRKETEIINRVQLYSLIMIHLSAESRIAIQEEATDFEAASTSQNPALLWKLVKRKHTVNSASGIHCVVLLEARQKYARIAQRDDETLVAFTARFKGVQLIYIELNEYKIPEAHVAMDYFNGLNEERYGGFKTFVRNNMASKSMAQPGTVALMQEQAQAYESPPGGGTPGAASTFVTTTEPAAGAEKLLTFAEEKAKRLIDNVCKHCKKKGHLKEDCRAPRWKEGAVCAAGVMCNHAGESTFVADDEGVLDCASEVSVVKKGLLTDVGPAKAPVNMRGVHGTLKRLELEGTLGGFGTVYVAPQGTITNVLSYAALEDAGVEITKHDGPSRFVVRMGECEVTFKRRGLLWVGNLKREKAALVTTLSADVTGYTKSEVDRAKLAGKFIENCGFPSLKEAVHLAEDSNIKGVTITGADIRRKVAIFGVDAAAVRGKMTKEKQNAEVPDYTRQQMRSNQELHCDVFYVGGLQFLMTVAKPLDLVITHHLQNQTAGAIGQGITKAADVLKAFGFHATGVLCDAHKSMLALEGSYAGPPVSPGGAGDHVPVADIKMRYLKELIRGVHASLPWDLPKSLIIDLVMYATKRQNIRRTLSSSDNVCPVVKLTGRKLRFDKELGLKFGEYVEVYKAAVQSNDALENRSEPCIALWPAGNRQQSWKLLSLNTGKRINRSNWKRMETTTAIVEQMNNRAAKERAGKEVEPLFDEADDIMDNELGERGVEQGGEPAGEPRHEVPQGIYLDGGEGDAVADPAPQIQRGVGSPPRSPATPERSPRDGPNDIREFLALQQPAGVMRLSDPEPGAQSPQPAEQQPTPSQRPPPQPTRESARIKLGVGTATPARYALHTLSVKAALREHGDIAMHAIVAELKQLLVDKKAISAVHRKGLSVTQLKKIIRSSMFLKVKHDSQGRFEKVKARLVADGSQQDRVLYPDTSSPTVALESLKMSLAIAANRRQHMATIDFTGAFLNAKMTGEEVLMVLDPTLTAICAKILPDLEVFVDDRNRLTVRVDRALYGLLQSSLIWFNELKSQLIKNGFKQNSVDQCVMNRGSGKDMTTINLYVDDLLCFSESQEQLERLVEELRATYKELTATFSDDVSYLGMHIKLRDGKAMITMEGYEDQLIEELGITRGAKTPATSDLFEPGTGALLCESKRAEFHTGVARLLYLCLRVKPEALVAVSYLCTRVWCATDTDVRKLNRVLQYVYETRGEGVVLDGAVVDAVTGHIDASFACHDDAKSQSGAAIMLGSACVMVKSGKQKIVTKDSTEAELVALSDSMGMVMKCHEFMESQGIAMKTPVLAQDNKSTITLVTKGGGQWRNKYLKVRQALVKERVDAGEATVVYTPTGMMIGDCLTKGLLGELFRHMRRLITGQGQPRGPTGCVGQSGKNRFGLLDREGEEN